jgi:hypothetical protein
MELSVSGIAQMFVLGMRRLHCRVDAPALGFLDHRNATMQRLSFAIGMR